MIQAQETVTLPDSEWMGVIWQQEADTLHWVNDAGEQLSIARPLLPDENTGANEANLYIAPNGEMLLITARLQDNRYGIGFYDFALGEIVAFHQTQENEEIVSVVGDVFTEDSAYAALVLRTPSTSAWRILVFDVATGGVPYILSHDPRTIPQAFVTELSRYPQVLATFSNGDGEADVRFQMIDPNGQQLAQSYGWRSTPDYPAGDVRADYWRFDNTTGFDLMPDDDESVLVVRINTAAGFPTIPNTGNTVAILPDAFGDSYDLATVTEGGVRNPLYVYNGRWIAYEEISVDSAQWQVVDRDSRLIVSLDESVNDVFHTPDGFLAQTDDNHLYHLTEDALALDTPIYSSDTESRIIYSTPNGATFTLETVTLP